MTGDRAAREAAAKALYRAYYNDEWDSDLSEDTAHARMNADLVIDAYLATLEGDAPTAQPVKLEGEGNAPTLVTTVEDLDALELDAVILDRLGGRMGSAEQGGSR